MGTASPEAGLAAPCTRSSAPPAPAAPRPAPAAPVTPSPPQPLTAGTLRADGFSAHLDTLCRQTRPPPLPSGLNEPAPVSATQPLLAAPSSPPRSARLPLTARPPLNLLRTATAAALTRGQTKTGESEAAAAAGPLTRLSLSRSPPPAAPAAPSGTELPPPDRVRLPLPANPKTTPPIGGRARTRRVTGSPIGGRERGARGGAAGPPPAGPAAPGAPGGPRPAGNGLGRAFGHREGGSCGAGSQRKGAARCLGSLSWSGPGDRRRQTSLIAEDALR